VPPLLPRFCRSQQEREDERRIAEIIVQAEADEQAPGPRRVARSADGHNWERRRGLPLISKGVSGSTVHTDPVRALLRKESKRR
jgi:hypothetical protein